MSAFAQCAHIFGYRSDVANAPLFHDEHTLLIPAGGQIVRYRLDGLPQKFIVNHHFKDQGHMTAVAITSTSRHLAVAERLPADNHYGAITAVNPRILIYDLMHDTSKRQRILTLPPDLQLNCSEIISLDFSPDAKLLIAQCGAPDWTLCLWLWEKNRLLATLKSTNLTGSPIKQVSFDPNDSSHICVTGDQIFKFLRFDEGHLKQQQGVQKLDLKNYTSHTWLPATETSSCKKDRLALACSTGEIFILENGDVRDILTPVVDDRSVDECSAVALCTIGTGFAVTYTNGITYLFEPEDLKDATNFYRLCKRIRMPTSISEATGLGTGSTSSSLDRDYFLTLAVSPMHETMIGMTANRALFSFCLSSVHLESDVDTLWERLGASSHATEVIDMSVCVRKPLISTCDRNILKVWNYETKELEMSKRFMEDISSCSLHPSGLHVLVGCQDKLRLYNLLIDDLGLVKDFALKSCKVVSFANGGHIFAAAHNSLIVVYSMTTLESVQHLQGHNARVRCLSWSKYDQALVSCGSDGAVYTWNPLSGQRINEVVNRGIDYTSATISDDGVYACGSDGTLCEIKGSDIIRKVKLSERMISVSMSSKLLYGSTATGVLRGIETPIAEPLDFTEFCGHSASVTKMVATLDGRKVITCSGDGSVIVWDAFERDRGIDQREVLYDGWTEEVLVSRFDLEEKTREISELKTRVGELKMESEYQLRLKDMAYREKVDDMREKYANETDALKTKSHQAREDRERQLTILEQDIKDMEIQFDDEKIEIEEEYQRKMMIEIQRYKNLEKDLHKSQLDHGGQMDRQGREHDRTVENVCKEFEGQIEELETRLQDSEEARQRLVREGEETVEQIEVDADREILEIRQKYESALKNKCNDYDQLNAEFRVARNAEDDRKKTITNLNDTIRRLQKEKKDQEGINLTLIKDMNGLKKERQERDEAIAEKEVRIHDLTKKTYELEKFKFVLDYKITELKKQEEPRTATIRHYEKVMVEMENELEKFNKDNISLHLEKSNHRQRIRAAESDLSKLRQQLRDSRTIIKNMKNEIHKAAGLIQDTAEMKRAVAKLHSVYCRTNQSAQGKKAKDADVLEAENSEKKSKALLARQKEHLEQSVAMLQKKSLKDKQNMKKAQVKIMQENVHLIAEINKLRTELKGSRVHVSNLETALGIKNSEKKKNNKNREAVEAIMRDYTAPLTKQRNQIDDLEVIVSRQQTQLSMLVNEKDKAVGSLTQQKRRLEIQRNNMETEIKDLKKLSQIRRRSAPSSTDLEAILR